MSTEPRPRRSSRPFADAPVVWAVVAVIAVAVVVGVAVLLTRAAPDQAPTGPNAAATQPRHPATVEAGAWWRVGWQADLQAPPAFDEIRIGTVGRGETFRMPIGESRPSGTPFIRGPVGGLVVVGTADVRRTELIVVEAATGTARDLVQVRPEALDVEISHDGRTVLFLAETDAGLAAYAVPIDGSGDVRQLTEAVPRVATGPGIVLAAVRLPSADLMLQPGGEALAILDCDSSCRLRVVRPGGGREIIFNLGGFETVLDWDGNVIVLGSGRCIDLAAEAFLPGACAGPEQAPPTGLEGWFAGVELPDRWHAELRSVGAGLVFERNAVAIGPEGEEVVLDVLGRFGGQG